MKAITRFWSAVMLTVAGAGVSGAIGLAARYGVPVPPTQATPQTSVSIHGEVTTGQPEAQTDLKGILIQVVNRGVQTTTDDNGHYTFTVDLAESETVQVLAVDADKQENGGNFSSAVADITLNTQNQRTADDTDQTVDFTLQAKKAAE